MVLYHEKSIINIVLLLSSIKKNHFGAKTVPRNHANKNKLHKNNDFMRFFAIESIENTTKKAIQIPGKKPYGWISDRSNAYYAWRGDAGFKLLA